MSAQRPHAATVQAFRPLAELVPAHWQSGFINSTDSVPIHYTRTGGAKPAVLLLHGIQVSGLTWLRTARALEATYDVVMPDFRGHGQSGGVEQGFSSEILVQDMITLTQSLGLDRPFVVGHSMGADIAGRLAAAHPVRAVVLVDPALQNIAALTNFSIDAPPPWMQSLFETMQALKTQSHAERMITGLRLLPPGQPLWDEADYVSFLEGQATFDLATFRHTTNMGYLVESPDVIARIACPILLLTARPMMPGAGVESGLSAFKQNWRDGQHVHFEDSGHFIPGDQFNRFIDVVTRFLGEH